MNQQNVIIEKAPPDSIESVLVILLKAGLPHDGVKEHISEFLIARIEGGEIIGCVGMEHYGKLGLLRSLAVSFFNKNLVSQERIVLFMINTWQAPKNGIFRVVRRQLS